MNKSLRFLGLCISSLMIVAFIGYVFLVAAKAQPEEVKCPCDYAQTIPKTQSCWTEPFDMDPLYNEIFDGEVLNICQVANGRLSPEPVVVLLNITTDGANVPDPAQCQITSFGNPECSNETINVVHTSLTPEEINACQCELLAYVTSLNEVGGLTVTGGPPSVCGNIRCTPAAVPTLNHWGMMITAGVLGLFAVIGLFVMRTRRRVAGG